MFTLKQFTKHWTTIYTPIAENGAKKQEDNFHCVESITKVLNLVNEIPNLCSPFVVMENNIGGEITDKGLRPEYNIYFFVKAKPSLSPIDEKRDDEAKEEAMRHALEYINYIGYSQEQMDELSESLKGIITDNIHFETFGPIYDRWFFVGISLEETARRSKCHNKSLYKQDASI